MSPGTRSRRTAKRPSCAPVFAALGDETRLSIVGRLAVTTRSSISELTRGSGMTRQAVTKHLRILEGAGIVRSIRSGRESLCELEPASLRGGLGYLQAVSSQWDAALARLRDLVET